MKPSLLLTGYFWLIVAYMIFPALIVIPVSFSSSEFLRFPPEDFGLRWYGVYFTDPVWIAATVTSFRVAVLSTVIATTVGTMTGLAIIRSPTHAQAPLTYATTIPIVIPHIFIALGVFILALRLDLTDNEVALAFAHAAVAMPFVVLITSAAIRQIDPTIERAARVLGAGPFRAFRVATLPPLLPAMVAAAIFAFFVSFDELIIAQFLMKGSETLPMRIWADLRLDISPVVAAVSGLLIVVTTVALACAEILRRRAISTLAP
ncbi:ABC transporter permease [Aquicoccus porphyridii]|uniref:ABC transporter permease n=2 Tax=Aquicoccus porphyridii TaxID=1852029 RepID=A0A5A9Z5I7_9RHOB|nr:ABC transporter permease [Aquicoccus porphyridii]RAI54489.1 ABC transporter permease [Rhodobacteraceae bacterium AsT-22]